MLIILEIILTIVAWKRGWKALSLLPIGIAFGVGLLAGLTGNVTPEFMQVAMFLDGIAIISLIVMSIVGKKQEIEK